MTSNSNRQDNAAVENYEMWMDITITHDYYDCGHLPVTIVPSESTNYLMRRHRILFMQREEGKWVMLCLRDRNGEMGVPDAGRTLYFEVRPSNAEFYYVTRSPKSLDNSFGLVASDKPGVWRVLEISVGTQAEGIKKINLSIGTVNKRMEFIFISKYNSSEINLALAETGGRIEFEGPEKIANIDGLPALRFVTVNAVTLRKSDSFKIQLLEVRDKGERMLCSNVPVPHVSESSLIEPETAITTYFYF